MSSYNSRLSRHKSFANRLKFLLIISVAFNILIVGIFAYKIYNNWFETTVLKEQFRLSYFDVAPKEPGKIYFIGDSHTEAFELNELLCNPDVRNRGIWGDNTTSALNRIDNIIQAKPAKVFIMIGVNDIGAGLSVNATADNIEEMVSKLKDSTTAKIYLESILPTNQLILHTKESSMDKIKQLNAAYKSIAVKYNIGFINLYPYFLGKKGLKEEYSFDGLHLNGQGYLKLAELLKPYL